jgi:hypothetical protein
MWLGALLKCKANISFQPHFISLFQIHFFYNTIHNPWSYFAMILTNIVLDKNQHNLELHRHRIHLLLLTIILLTHPSIQQRQYFLILHRQTYMSTFSFGNELSICAFIYNLGQSGPSYYKNQDYTIWKYYMGFLKFLNCPIVLDYDM